MILQIKTRRSLSWTGCIAVLGAGLLLLPLRPIQAQAPDDANGASKKEQAEQQRVQKAVEKALEYLRNEDQANSHKSGKTTKADTKAIQKAQAQLENARAEFEVARAHLEAAQQRLAKLQGNNVFFYTPVITGAPDQKRIVVYTTTDQEKPIKLRVQTAEGLPARAGAGLRWKAQPVNPGQGTPLQFRFVQPQKSGGSVEEKLNHLQRQIEELRRELKQQHSRTNGKTKDQIRYGVFRVKGRPQAIPLAPATVPTPATAPIAPSVSPAPAAGARSPAPATRPPEVIPAAPAAPSPAP